MRAVVTAVGRSVELSRAASPGLRAMVGEVEPLER